MLLLSVIPLATYGQNSSLNTFSPYTFYGIGDFATQGPGYIRSMGGAGIGFRNSLKINYMNPASYSILRQKTFLFNVEMEGVNTYSKTRRPRPVTTRLTSEIFRWPSRWVEAWESASASPHIVRSAIESI